MDDERLRFAREAAAFAIHTGNDNCDGDTVVAIMSLLDVKDLEPAVRNGIAGHAFNLILATKSLH